MSLHTVTIGGLPIAALDCAQTASLMLDQALARRGQAESCLYHTSANGQVIAMCAKDDQLKQAFVAADLINADGQPMVFASRHLTALPLPERVATTDLFHHVARQAQERGARFYFLGATEDVNRKTVENVARRYPALDIVGRRNGYFSRDEESALVEEINALQPDILWLAMGVPHEQGFCLRNRDALTGVGLIKTSGGLFDFLSGKNSRAPQWMQEKGLEWLYRIWLEPRRLFWRYFVTNPHAIYVMLRQSGTLSVQP